MPTSSTLLTEIFILVVRIGLIGMLYLFLWHVLRVTTRQLRQVSATQAAPRPKYGALVFVEGPDIAARRIARNSRYSLHIITTIGRSPACSIVLTDDLVSDEHAQIVWKNSQSWLEDVDSTNGTWLNLEAVTRPTPLGEGDIITVGETRFKWTAK
jgi:pSer/pThr/pTyr-binding forkhead associated (FHA) protein